MTDSKDAKYAKDVKYTKYAKYAKYAVGKQNNIYCYSKITVNFRPSFRLCHHNYKQLPSNNRIINEIFNYHIELDAWMYLFNHLGNNCAYHIVIEGKETYFPEQDEDRIITFVTYSCRIVDELIILTDVYKNVYKITSDMIINLFIIRKIKYVSCINLHDCIFTKLFESYEFTHTKFIKLHNMATYSSNCYNVHKIPKVSYGSITKSNCTWISIHNFKLLFKKNNPYFKQVKIVNWDNQCRYMVVYQLQSYKDKGILGKRIDRRGIKLISIEKEDSNVVVYENDTNVKEVIIIRNVIINDDPTDVKVVFNDKFTWRTG